jgi:hypothetical protein
MAFSLRFIANFSKSESSEAKRNPCARIEKTRVRRQYRLGI